MATPTAPGTWLVETALKGAGEPVWEVRTGCTRETSAREEVRQLGARWRRQGYRVRVRFEAAPDAQCLICGRRADSPFRVRTGERITAGCVAKIHDDYVSGADAEWVRGWGAAKRETGYGVA